MMKSPLTPALFLALGFTVSAQDKPAEKVTYVDHVRPLLENKCFSCHNPDKKKGDLDLTSFTGTMSGGGSGAVVNAGDPDGSKLMASILKKEEPFMPPEGAPMGAKDIEVLHQWIQGGLLETASSVAKKAAPKANLALASAPTGKPDGPPPMPENVLLEPVVVAPRGTVITALAASPWAPVVAVSGAHQALIYDVATRSLAGVYPYPEGYVRSLKFSQNGGLLIAGGGRGGKSGNAVVWDVKSGRRITEVGHEFDQVMGADISPNQAMIAIGSPSKKVKCFNASTGEELYVIKKHTEWVLQIAFSPDGVLLASADRNGGIIISEAANGGEFYVLDGHKASCTGLAWRSDSNVLASCSEDGKLAVWEMQNGKLVKSWDAHGGGVESVSFTPNGNIASCGRDGIVRFWDINGKKLGETKSSGDILTKVAAISDSKTVAVGDWQGNVRFLKTDDMSELGAVTSNPSPISQRIADCERVTNELAAQIPVSDAKVKSQEADVQAKEAQVAAAKKTASETEANRNKLEAELKDWPNKVAALEKQRVEAAQKRNIQTDAIKTHEQALAQIKQLEAVLASLNADKAKLTAPEQAPKLAEVNKQIAERSAKIETLKKAHATAPQAIAEFEKAVKAAQEAASAYAASKPAKQKQLEAAKKAVTDAPKVIAESEKQLAAAKAALEAERKHGLDLRAQLAWEQKQPAFLHAAQFNVGVLDEKQKLEKLEADVKGLQEAVKETEDAKKAAAQRAEAGKKTLAESGTKIPALDTALAKLKADVPALEKSLEPLKQEEAKTAAKVQDQKKAMAAKEAEWAAIGQAKAKQMTIVQRATAELGLQVTTLQKQIDEVNGKLAAPQKVLEAKKPELLKVEADLAGASKPIAGLEKTASQISAKFEAVSQAAQSNPNDPNIKIAFDAAKGENDAAQGALTKAKSAVAALKHTAAGLNQEIAVAEKTAGPLRDQLAKIRAQADGLRKALVEKQAAIAAVEKDSDAKAKPVSTAIAQLKGSIEPMENQLVALRGKIAASTRELAAKRNDLAKAQTELDAAKQAQASAQKTVDGAAKEAADKEKILAETKAELAKNEPQLEPQRAKVKQMTEQYFAMLPKPTTAATKP
jgi:DNA repair exonuclease SbcCD ATPase subunit